VNIHPPEQDGIRILVADDSLLLRTLVEDSLLKAGFRVMTAVNGREAWELLQTVPFHLLIADIYMPHLDGLALTAMIRANSQLSELPVILLSAIDAAEDRQRGLAYGANAFVMKERRDLASLPDQIVNLIRLKEE
jgi:two-component system, chemotaxis family, sensor kinase CheA